MARLLSGYSRLPVELETRKSSKGNPCLCPILGQYLAELPPKRLDLSRFYLSIIFCGTTKYPAAPVPGALGHRLQVEPARQE
jgi:hypothetical protein